MWKVQLACHNHLRIDSICPTSTLKLLWSVYNKANQSFNWWAV